MTQHPYASIEMNKWDFHRVEHQEYLEVEVEVDQGLIREQDPIFL
jgi:hypothetical protein